MDIELITQVTQNYFVYDGNEIEFQEPLEDPMSLEEFKEFVRQNKELVEKLLSER